VARFLVDEVHVRAVTEIFESGVVLQQQQQSRGPTVTIQRQSSPENTLWDDAMLSKYLFKHAQSPLFRDSDIAGLSALDKDTVHDVGEVLRNSFRFILHRGFQHPMANVSVPRETPHIPLSPLNP
jgi:hypothetical protein